MKESDDPESTRDLRITLGSMSVVKERKNESGLERVDAPSNLVFTVSHEGVLCYPQ